MLTLKTLISNIIVKTKDLASTIIGMIQDEASLLVANESDVQVRLTKRFRVSVPKQKQNKSSLPGFNIKRSAVAKVVTPRKAPEVELEKMGKRQLDALPNFTCSCLSRPWWSENQSKKREDSRSDGTTRGAGLQRSPPQWLFAGKANGGVAGWKVPHSNTTFSSPMVTVSSSLSADGKSGSMSAPTFLGSHKGGVTCIAFFPWKQLVVSGSYDCQLKIWDFQSLVNDNSGSMSYGEDQAQSAMGSAGGGCCIQTIPAHDSTVTVVAVHCNLIISGSVDKTLKVWSMDEGREGLALPWLSVRQVFLLDAWASALWTSPFKIAETQQGEVFVGDSRGNVTVLRSITSTLSSSSSVADMLVSKLELQRQGDLGGHEEHQTSSEHRSTIAGTIMDDSLSCITNLLPVTSLNLLISLSYGTHAKINDAHTLKLVSKVQHPCGAESGMNSSGNTTRFLDCAWVAEKEDILLLDNHNVVFLWSTRSSKWLTQMSVGSIGTCNLLSPLSDIQTSSSSQNADKASTVIATTTSTSGDEDDPHAAARRLSIQALQDSVEGTPSRSQAAGASKHEGGQSSGIYWLAHREALEGFSIDRFSSFVEHKGHGDRIINVLYNYSGTGSGSPGAVGKISTPSTAHGSTAAVGTSLDFRFATASVDNTICFWTPHLLCIHKLAEKHNEISCFALVVELGWCVTGHENGSLKFWNLNRDRTFRFMAHDNTVSAVCEGLHKYERGTFFPWHHIFTVSYDGCLAVWDMPNEGSKAKCEARLRVSSSELLCAAYDDIKKMYIVGDNAGEVSMWSVDDLQPMRKLQHSPDSALVLARGENSDDEVDDEAMTFLEPHQRQATVAAMTGSTNAHREAVTCIALDGNFSFTGGEDGKIYMWNTVTGGLAKELIFPCDAMREGHTGAYLRHQRRLRRYQDRRMQQEALEKDMSWSNEEDPTTEIAAKNEEDCMSELGEVQQFVVVPETGDLLVCTRSGKVVRFSQNAHSHLQGIPCHQLSFPEKQHGLLFASAYYDFAATSIGGASSTNASNAAGGRVVAGKEVSSIAWNRQTNEIIAGLEDGIMFRVHETVLSAIVVAVEDDDEVTEGGEQHQSSLGDASLKAGQSSSI